MTARDRLDCCPVVYYAAITRFLSRHPGLLREVRGENGANRGHAEQVMRYGALLPTPG